MASAKRQQSDVMKLMAAFDITIDEDPAALSKGMLNFQLRGFKGPKETPYEGGVYTLSVHLPPDYPMRSPSIGFRTRIFHPNIDEKSGSICLDVINQQWTPMYELRNIFDVFLPQLLAYPNPADPLNPEAASLLNREPDKYHKYVREHTAKHAIPAAASPASTSAATTSTSASTSASASGAKAATAAAAAAGAGSDGSFSDISSSSKRAGPIGSCGIAGGCGTPAECKCKKQKKGEGASGGGDDHEDGKDDGATHGAKKKGKEAESGDAAGEDDDGEDEGDEDEDGEVSDFSDL